jgi:nucleoside-diphosphate-sugar epimerase
MHPDRHVLITGGAGYIGSLLCGRLLRQGFAVTVVDDLLYGGESLLAVSDHPNFSFAKADVCEPRAIRSTLRTEWPAPESVVHLAAIVGFPACQAVGRQVAWRYNAEATQRVFEQAVEAGIKRFIFASSYSNYGISSGDDPLDEDAPLNPQSLYAETKVFAESFLLTQADGGSAPVIFRMATLYGLSPRPRFDLLVNQFVCDAFSRRELLIYQRGYLRSYLHVRDAVEGICLALQAPEEKIRGQAFNLGSDSGNFTKDEIASLILKRLPETRVRYKDMTFGGDMRDIRVSFDKVRIQLGFNARYSLEDGIREVLHALRDGLIREPQNERYRNARFIVA